MLWGRLKQASSPSVLPAGCVIGLTVLDPRLDLPVKKISTATGAEGINAGNYSHCVSILGLYYLFKKVSFGGGGGGGYFQGGIKEGMFGRNSSMLMQTQAPPPSLSFLCHEYFNSFKNDRRLTIGLLVSLLVLNDENTQEMRLSNVCIIAVFFTEESVSCDEDKAVSKVKVKDKKPFV